MKKRFSYMIPAVLVAVIAIAIAVGAANAIPRKTVIGEAKGVSTKSIQKVVKLDKNRNNEIQKAVAQKFNKQYEVYGFQIGEQNKDKHEDMHASVKVDQKFIGKQVNVYRYNEGNKQCSFVDMVLVDKKGNAAFTCYKNGIYFTTSTEVPRFAEKDVKLVFEDNFGKDGAPSLENWKYAIGGDGWGNNEKQCYTDSPTNASVKDGKLMITARKERYAFNDYTSAKLMSNKAWLYGRFEVKAKLPMGTGTWPAIWMMPKDEAYGSWPQSGEIDIMEHVGFDPGMIHATTHCAKYYWKNNNQKTGQIHVDGVDTDYHVYSVEWTPHKIDAFVDGKKYFTYELEVKDKLEGTSAWPFDKPFYLIMNIAVGGSWGGTNGIDDSIFPQQMQVDYVKVFDLGVEAKK